MGLAGGSVYVTRFLSQHVNQVRELRPHALIREVIAGNVSGPVEGGTSIDVHTSCFAVVRHAV